MLLAINNISAGYGPLEVISSVSMDVGEGECVSLIGWSGAGKTTLLKTIAGLIRPFRGNIIYRGANIAAAPAHERVQMGIALVPEGRRLFAGMTTRENLLVGAHCLNESKMIHQQLGRVLKLFPVLAERCDQIAGTLSGGEQQMCAIGRALMSSPRMILIDELSLGLAPVVVDRLTEALAHLRHSGTTMVLVEQNAELALKLSDRAYVMQRGRIVTSVKASDALNDSTVWREKLQQRTNP
jgi:branched-chain amino acid transport system ATP-binding protein